MNPKVAEILKTSTGKFGIIMSVGIDIKQCFVAEIVGPNESGGMYIYVDGLLGNISNTDRIYRQFNTIEQANTCLNDAIEQVKKHEEAVKYKETMKCLQKQIRDLKIDRRDKFLKAILAHD